MRRTSMMAIVGVLALLALPALAHHSYTNFFLMDQTVEITGVVKSLKLVNPHPELTLEVIGPDGEKTSWYITARGTGSAVLAAGWTPDWLPIGSEITIEGNPSRRPNASAIAAGKITKEDGSIVWFGGGGGIPQG